MQEYQMVLRGLTTAPTKFDEDGGIEYQNFSEFMSWMNTQYLSKEWQIHSEQLVRVIPEVSGQTPLIYEYVYHLVRDLVTKSK